MTKRSEKALEVVHYDICDTFEISSLVEASISSLFDENTRMVWLYTIKFKSEVLEVFKKFNTLIEKESGKQLIKVFRTGGSGDLNALVR